MKKLLGLILSGFLLASVAVAAPPNSTPAVVKPGTVTLSGSGGFGFSPNSFTALFSNGGTVGATVPVTTVATSGTSQAIAFAATGNAAYDITLTANCTITLSGGTAGQLQSVTLYLRQNTAGGNVPTLPTGVRWPNSTPPTPNTVAGKIDAFTFTTPDGGVTIFGSY